MNVIKKAASLNQASDRCTLWNWEKSIVIYKPHMASLYKRNRLLTTTRLYKKFLFQNIKPP